MIVIVSPRFTTISPSAVTELVLNAVNDSKKRTVNIIGTQYDFLMMCTSLGKWIICSVILCGFQDDVQKRDKAVTLLRLYHQFISLFLGFYSPIECILLGIMFGGVHMLNEGTMVQYPKQPFLD
jgi:hypothetical protein